MPKCYQVLSSIRQKFDIVESTVPADSERNGNRNAEKHGVTTLKKAIKQLGNRAIDKRTTTGRELAKWRNDLIEDWAVWITFPLSSERSSIL